MDNFDDKISQTANISPKKITSLNLQKNAKMFPIHFPNLISLSSTTSKPWSCSCVTIDFKFSRILNERSLVLLNA